MEEVIAAVERSTERSLQQLGRHGRSCRPAERGQSELKEHAANPSGRLQADFETVRLQKPFARPCHAATGAHMGTGGSYPARELVVLISSVDHAKPHLLSSAGQQAGPASRGPTPKVEVVGSSPVSRAIDIPGRESQEPDLERVKSIVAVAPNPAGATGSSLRELTCLAAPRTPG